MVVSRRCAQVNGLSTQYWSLFKIDSIYLPLPYNQLLKLFLICTDRRSKAVHRAPMHPGATAAAPLVRLWLYGAA